MIRRANNNDVDKLYGLNEEFFGETRDYRNLIACDDTEVFVYELKGMIIGITGLKINDWNNTGLLLNIFIHPNHRKRGYASEMLQEMVGLAGKKDLRCLIAEAPSNSNAPALFQSNNFRKCGHNDRYYDNLSNEIAEFYSIDL